MKKIAILLLAVLLVIQSFPALAANACESYLETALQSAEIDESKIDNEKIFAAEMTNYLMMKKGKSPTKFCLMMPFKESDDYYASFFDNGSYMMTEQNLSAVEPLKRYNTDALNRYLLKNNLSDPTDIKALIVYERMHMFAYHFMCGGTEYIIPYEFTDESLFNMTDDADCALEIGKAYTVDEFVAVCEKEAAAYDVYRAEKEEARKNENTSTSIDDKGDEVVNDKKAEKKTYLETTKKILDGYQKGENVYLTACSYQSYVNIAKNSGVNSNDDLSTEEKAAIYDILAGLYDAVMNNSKAIERKTALGRLLSLEKQTAEYEFTARISIHNRIDGDYYFELIDNYIVAPWGGAYTENPQAIISYLESGVKEHKDVLHRGSVQTVVSDIDLAKGTYQGKPYQLVEKLSFDIKLTEELRKTPLGDIAGRGETVCCTIEQINTGGRDMFVLSMNGSKGLKQYFTLMFSSLEFGGETGNKLKFSTSDIFDGRNMISDTSSQKIDKIIFGGKSSGKKVCDVTMSMELAGMNKIPAAVSADNVKYEFYGDEKSLQNKRNLFVLFGLTKENTIFKNAEAQDPEHYVTKLRNSYADDDEIVNVGFYLDFAAQAKLNVNSNHAPEWYKKLGENVSVTVAGVTQTLNGEDRMSYTMLRFKGDKGTQWFDLSTSAPSKELAAGEYNNENADLFVSMSYHSLISFDGFTTVRNTVACDHTDAKIHFTNDGKLDLDAITFEIGSQKVKISADELNYIGGGVLTYEKLF